MVELFHTPGGAPDGIERLKKRLYSRTASIITNRRRSFTPTGHQSGVGMNWQDSNEELAPPPSPLPGEHKTSLLTWVFVGSICFFLLAAAIAVFTFWGGGNIVSPDNIDITIAGPAQIGGGELLSLDVSVTNNNRVTLELSDLLIEYPDGTRRAGNISDGLKRDRQTLGDIAPANTARRTIQSVLFGEQDATKTIKVAVEYRVAGSNAIFVKEKNYDVLISSSPVSLSVKALKEVTAGQTVEFIIEVISNSTNTIEETMLIAEYPFGFTFESADPASAFGKDTWYLGDVGPQSRRTIRLKGKLAGEDGEERTFRFNVGTRNQANEKEIGAVFLSSIQSVLLKKPFIGINLALNGDEGAEYISRSGRLIRADILWQNNTPDTLTDVGFQVKLSGQALDRSSVSVSGGFYRSIDNTIIWSSNSMSDLESVQSGAEGRLSFSFASLPNVTGALRSPNIILSVDAKAKRSVDSAVPEELVSSVTRTVKFSSDLLLTTRIVHSSGPIVNIGPIPPKAEKETTYTIAWSVANGANDVREAKVVTILPSYVRFTGSSSPLDEKISFNPIGGEVVWDIGEVPAGTGISKPRREVAFQVALLPSLSQVGTSPKITEENTLVGLDSFTNTLVKDIKNGLTTRIITDPLFKNGDEIVLP
jgi:hypothetical protein